MAAAGYFCPACLRPVPEFTALGSRPRARCPRCQALERHRFLAFLLRSLGPVITSARAVLDIAPHLQVQRVLEGLVARERYIAIDLFAEREIDAQADITRLPFRDGAFDLIICYHVFEHIPDDASAMSEVARVLAPGGLALVQVPRRYNRPTDEDPSAPPEERIRRFGQEDHVRLYGDDFEARLVAGRLQPYVIRPTSVLAPSQVEFMGISDVEPVWICRSTAHDERFSRSPWPGAGAIDLPSTPRMPGFAPAAQPPPPPLYRRVGGKVKRLVR